MHMPSNFYLLHNSMAKNNYNQYNKELSFLMFLV